MKIELTTQVKGVALAANLPTLDVIPTAAANVAMGSNRITGLGDPTGNQDAATKNYVDATASGLSVKDSCLLATTSALPSGTYSNGSSGAGATFAVTATGTLTIDGTVTALNQRILVKNQVSTFQNGIYYVSTAGAGGVAAILTRVPDMSVATQPVTTGGQPAASPEYVGAFTFIESGTANGGTGWLCTTTGAVTVGTTGITFTQFNSGSSYSAGNGINITGTTVTAVAATNSGIQVTSGGIGVLLNGSTLTLGSSGISVTAGGIGPTQLAAQAGGTGLQGGAGTNLSVLYSIRETPSGSINGSNTSFTLAHTPISGYEEIYLNGLLLDAGGGADYTISGTAITMITAPITGDKLRVSYPY